MNQHTFPSHDVPEHDAGRVHEAHCVSSLLREMCDRARISFRAAGRPNYPLGDRLVPAALTACYGITGQGLVDILKAQAGDGPRPSPAPDVARCLHDPALTPALADMVAESASPLAAVERDFVVTTGALPSPGGEDRVRARIRCGTRTGVVIAAEVVTAQGARHLPPAMAATRRISTVPAQNTPAGRRLGRAAASRVFSKVGARPDTRLRLRSERAHVNLMLLRVVVHNLSALARAGLGHGIRVDASGGSRMPMVAHI